MRLELLNKLRGKGSLNHSVFRKSETVGTQREFEEETKQLTMRLIKRMHEACSSDHQAILDGRAALQRFKLTEELQDQLRKKHIQKLFLEMQGCRFIEMWLGLNPDGSFPPIQVINCMLTILDKLPITEDVLSNCQVAHVLTQYATSKGGSLDENGRIASQEQLPQDTISRATKLL